MACGHSEWVNGCPDCAVTRIQARPPPRGPLEGPLQGRQVGRYLLGAPVGAGGMGVVYLAQDPELERRVAIKLLLSGPQGSASDPAAQARLLREAQAMARVSDPHVIPVHDVGTFEQGVFLAMEFVDGQTLGDWLRLDRPSWPSIVTTFIEAGQGLAAAHRAGVVHRDFKPGNVLLGKDGRVLVGDFGLARAATTPANLPLGSAAPVRTSTMTADGPLMGTPGYMAPEQYAGQPAAERADQFAFCASLYEALYGFLPFPGDTLDEVARNTLQGEPTPPPRDSKVPERLWRTLRRGLARDPAGRFASMDQLLGELQRALAVPSIIRRRTILALAVGVAGLSLFGALRNRGVTETVPRNPAEEWWSAAKTSCNAIEVSQWMRRSPPPAGPEGAGYAAACYALAGQMSQASTAIEALAPSDRSRAALRLFDVVHPVADNGDDLIASPAMHLVLRYAPDAYQALYHAGVADFGLGNRPLARDELTRFTALYLQDDSFRREALRLLALMDAQ